ESKFERGAGVVWDSESKFERGATGFRLRVEGEVGPARLEGCKDVTQRTRARYLFTWGPLSRRRWDMGVVQSRAGTGALAFRRYLERDVEREVRGAGEFRAVGRKL